MLGVHIGEGDYHPKTNMSVVECHCSYRCNDILTMDASKAGSLRRLLGSAGLAESVPVANAGGDDSASQEAQENRNSDQWSSSFVHQLDTIRESAR